MLFNSIEFLVFFPTVCLLYFLLAQRFRWLLLLAASCVFYMAFIPVYILVLGVTIAIDYTAAIWIERSRGRRRRAFLWLSIVSTCLVLFVFKYFNFFSASCAALATLLHWNYPVAVLDIILPIGLSFHTFQSLSYVVEVYRGRQPAERNFGIYALYVMFFPQLVAGPIERPQNLLHQFYETHAFDYQRATDGLKLMAWGLFKKAVIADRVAGGVGDIFGRVHEYSGPGFMLATMLFAIQIYCDFSGYSDIAIGAAQVMGFRLMENFRRPYFAGSVGEFWQRWHISLSTWFRDYLYIPLGGSRVPAARHQFNLLATFLISGLWHGANWTYVVWGGLNGCFLVAERWTATARSSAAAALGLTRWPRLMQGLAVGRTFSLICLAWVFFRANSIGDAWHMSTHLASGWHGGRGGISEQFEAAAGSEWPITVAAVAGLLAVQFTQRQGRVRKMLATRPAAVRWTLYVGVVMAILVFGVFGKNQFIYFQF